MRKNTIVLLAQKHDSMEFDKDEIISKIENFDQFDGEGLSIRHLCTHEIAKSIGVEESDIYITKLDWTYRDNTKYLASYCVNYYYDEEEIRDVIEEYAQRFDTNILKCDITNADETIYINVTFIEGKKFSDTKLYNLSRDRVLLMLKDRYPNFEFNVKVTFRVMF